MGICLLELIVYTKPHVRKRVSSFLFFSFLSFFSLHTLPPNLLLILIIHSSTRIGRSQETLLNKKERKKERKSPWQIVNLSDRLFVNVPSASDTYLFFCCKCFSIILYSKCETKQALDKTNLSNCLIGF